MESSFLVEAYLVGYSLWMKCVLKIKFFWTMNPYPPTDLSWTWGKIVKLRVLGKPLDKYTIGDWTSTFFWHDYWLPRTWDAKSSPPYG